MGPPNARFNGIYIGTHANLVPSYANELEIKKIPRADGCIVRRRGGGVQTLVVHAWTVKNDRQSLEDYLAALAISFGSGAASLIISGTTYTNTFFQSISPESDDHVFNRFTVTFVRNNN